MRDGWRRSPSPHGSAGGSSLRTALVLAAIVVVAAALRIPGLDRVPPALFCDEASAGYDALCLLETGRDQYGERLPLFARSFGDYDEALLRYSTVPAVAALGLTETAVRLPVAIWGILSVPLAFALGRAWFGTRVGLLTAGLMAVSSWHVHFSRVGFRAVLLPCFLMLGAWLLRVALVRPRRFLAAGAVFGLACYTYAPVRIVLPLLLVGWALVFRKILRRRRRWALAGATVLLVVAAPALRFALTPEGLARARYESIFRDRSFREGLALAATAYVGYFGPRFLVTVGDANGRHGMNDRGPLRPDEALLLVLGLGVALVRRRPEDRAVVIWALVAPVAAALSRGPPSSLRTLVAVPAVCLLAAMGAERVISWAARPGRARLARVVVAVALAILALGGAARRQVDYHMRYPVRSAGFWTYGWKEAIETAKNAIPPEAPIYVSDRFALAHSYVLFFERIDPAVYQADPVPDLAQGRWIVHHRIGRFRFENVRGAYAAGRPGAYILRGDEWPGIRPERTVRLPDGRPAFYIAILGESRP